MNFYWTKTNSLIKKIFPNYIWDIPNSKKVVYLTFDDGPTPEITNWTLQQLQNYNARATFFCIGKNIDKYPEIFQKIIANGHVVGNHTFDHLNGWEIATPAYINNVEICKSAICNQQSTINNLFRPPYGKIKPSQSKKLRKLGYKIIMWDVLSADFDANVLPQKCLENVISNVQSGSIIVFHDSQKAFRNLEYSLPRTLQFLTENGFTFDVIK
jgi:peptidoglycan-N-acetylglucosamine deacetylase